MPATDSFDAFYRDARSRVAVHLYAITGDVVEAQDVTQEAFARAIDQTVRFVNELLDNGVMQWVPAKKGKAAARK